MFNGNGPTAGVATADYFRGAVTPNLTFYTRHAIIVDWDGNGGFTSPYSDISSDVIGPVQTIRGKDYASQLTGRSVAGAMSCTLRNDDGRYSSFNATSPLYGKILPRRKVQVWAVAPYVAVLWSGFLDSIEPVATGGEPMSMLRASGIFKVLGDQASKAYPAAQTNVLASDVITAVLDAVGHPTADRLLQAGTVPVGAWFADPDGIIALEALQQMEEVELGFLHEGLAWDVVFEDRYYRLLFSTASQAPFSDDPASNFPYIGITQLDSVREIYNEVTANVTPYTAAALAVLWTLANEQPYLAPGASITLKATYSGGYVNPWTTPVAGVDVVSATGTLAIALVSSSGTHLTFTVTNNHATAAAVLSTVQVRGVAYTAGQTTQVQASDSTSQSKYRKRVYPLGSPWYSSSAYAQAACDYFVSRQKDEHPVLEMAFTGSPNAGFALIAGSLALSNRISVEADKVLTELGLASSDFFIESISHSFGPGLPWIVTLKLSPAGVHEPFWLLGDSTYGVLGTTTKLAY